MSRRPKCICGNSLNGVQLLKLLKRGSCKCGKCDNTIFRRDICYEDAAQDTIQSKGRLGILLFFNPSKLAQLNQSMQTKAS